MISYFFALLTMMFHFFLSHWQVWERMPDANTQHGTPAEIQPHLRALHLVMRLVHFAALSVNLDLSRALPNKIACARLGLYNASLEVCAPIEYM